MRALYTLTIWLALPLVFVRLWWRGMRQPEYRRQLGERFGRYRNIPARPVIWLHAVSVGETRAAQPLVKSLREARPDHAIVLTCMTPTGRATAEELYGSAVTCMYLPYDYPFAVRRFLRAFRPRIGLIMETEVWPNLIALCGEEGVPLALVNARLSARSARGYARVASLSRPAFAGFALVAAQTAADRDRLAGLGARDVRVTGNMKFDATPARELVMQGRAWRDARGQRKMLLAASTRDGEEALLLDALMPMVRAGHLLALVPRHPQRFDEVARLATARGLTVARRTTTETPGPDIEVWLGDSMGEMAAYYAAADCAFVGGSLLPTGGQNLIEACAVGCPVLIGPHTYNFAEAAAAAVSCGAAIRVQDAPALAREVERLLNDPAACERMCAEGLSFTVAHRGATDRTMALIEPLIRS